MPDFERVIRSLEVYRTRSDVERAFVLGHHAGEDRARRQVVWVAVAIAIAAVAIAAGAEALPWPS